MRGLALAARAANVALRLEPALDVTNPVPPALSRRVLPVCKEESGALHGHRWALLAKRMRARRFESPRGHRFSNQAGGGAKAGFLPADKGRGRELDRTQTAVDVPV